MTDVTLVIAFVAGVVSFLSPCVLPIIPGFLAYLSGVSIEDGSVRKRFSVFINSAFFVLGFSVIFAILGVVLNTVLQSVAYEAQVWLARIGGVIIIFFGLYLAGLIKVGFLEAEHRLRVTRRFNSRYATSFVFGAAFAVGWTPCVGAALGAILGLAASSPGSAFALLMSYSLGLGIPFLAIGFFTDRATSLIQKYSSVLSRVNVIFGVILIILGVLVFTQSLNLIANFDFVNRLILG